MILYIRNVITNNIEVIKIVMSKVKVFGDCPILIGFEVEILEYLISKEKKKSILK